MNSINSGAYNHFKKEFTLLKNQNEDVFSHYFIINDGFEWNTISYRNSDIHFTGKSHFMSHTGFLPFLVDTVNEDFYCFLPDKDKIGVFSIHTIVHIYENLDELIISLKNLIRKQLYNTLLKIAKQGNCFNQDTRKILLRFKNSGGSQEEAISVLHTIKNTEINNHILQDGADDILDIATGYCNLEMRVWN